MRSVSLKALLEAGCHFGHKTERWHPKAAQFIYAPRNGIHIIDLAKTKKALEEAAEFLKDVAEKGETALFVGTKRQAQAIVKERAEEIGAPYLTHRWIGGFLTNWEQVHTNLEKIRKLEEEKAKNVWNKYPKHERVKLDRYLSRLKITYGGVLELFELPKAIFLADIRKEKAAVKEAVKRGVKVIGIVDTNSDPTPLDYPIPANDDAVGSIKFIVGYLTAAYAEGKATHEKKQQAEAAKKEEKKDTPASTSTKATVDKQASEKQKDGNKQVTKKEKEKPATVKPESTEKEAEKTKVAKKKSGKKAGEGEKRGRPKKE